MLNPVLIKKIHPDAALPKKGTRDATGYDISSVESLVINPGEVKAVSTGLVVNMSRMSDGVDLQIRPRSGLAFKHSVTVINSPGTIDKDYRGEIKVLLINHGDKPFSIEVGDRIAQLVFGLYIPSVTFFPMEHINEDTERGAGGFGSTGVSIPKQED